MPFRTKNHYLYKISSPVMEIEDITLPTGEYIKQLVNQNEKILPDPELFDLKNQINAGIELEEVNSKITRAKSVNAEKLIRKYTKKTKETTDE